MKRIVLIGMPNTGKSTFFNRLTGASSRTGNWPGVTVDLLAAKILVGAEMVEVVDLPGIYDLHGFSDDEGVVRQFLENNPVELVCLVLNSTQLDHQLGLAVQVGRLGLNCVLLLNMSDEAQHLGVRVDTDKMAAELGFPVVLLSARRGHGFPRAKELMTSALAGAAPCSLLALRR
ncbi:MAG: FeoB small GTPase domain-containing protein, partial [Chromatiaceae bacterium]